MVVRMVALTSPPSRERKTLDEVDDKAPDRRVEHDAACTCSRRGRVDRSVDHEANVPGGPEHITGEARERRQPVSNERHRHHFKLV